MSRTIASALAVAFALTASDAAADDARRWTAADSSQPSAAGVDREEPSLASARLVGRFDVEGRVVRLRDFGGRVGTKKRSTWAFKPCISSACAAKAVFSVSASAGKAWHAIRVPLRRTGATYSGSAWGSISTCNGREISSSISVRLTVKAGAMISQTWRTSEWSGALMVRSPAIIVGSAHCTAGTYVEAIEGTLIIP